MIDEHYIPLCDKGRIFTFTDWAKCAIAIGVLIPASIAWLAAGLVRVAWLRANEVLR